MRQKEPRVRAGGGVGWRGRERRGRMNGLIDLSRWEGYIWRGAEAVTRGLPGCDDERGPSRSC